MARVTNVSIASSGNRAVEVGVPVVQHAVRVGRVDHLLHGDVRHRLDHVEAGGPELAQRPEHLVALGGITHVEHDDADDGLAAHRLGHELLRRRGDERHAAADLVGRGEDEVAVEAHELARHRRRVHELAGEHDRADRVQTEVERGDDAEVAAATPQTPEQVGVLVLGRDDLAAVGGHDLGLDEVVAGEAELALEPAAPAPERQTADAGVRHAAAGDGEAVLLGGGVDRAPLGTAPDAGDALLGVDVDRCSSREGRRQMPASTTAAPVTPWPPP